MSFRGKFKTRTPSRFKKSIAKQALALAKRNKRDLKQQNEIQFTAQGGMLGITLSTTPLPVLVSDTAAVIEGTSYLNKGLELLGDIVANLSSTIQDNYRIDVILDRRPNGVAFSAANAYGNATPGTNALLSITERDRYKIIKSWRGTFNTVDGITDNRKISFNRKFKFKSELSASGVIATAANIKTNAIYVVAWTNSASNQPFMNINGVSMHTE